MKFNSILVETSVREHAGKTYKSIVLEDASPRAERLTHFVEMSIHADDEDILPHLKPDMPVSVNIKNTGDQFQGVPRWIGRIDRASLPKNK